MKKTIAHLLLCAGLAAAPKGAAAQPVESHPRLWVRGEDLPRLRALAVSSNPYYQDGLLELAEHAKDAMDTPIAGNNVPWAGANRAGMPSVPWADEGTSLWVAYPTESYAMLFAFMSLLHDEGTPEHADYVDRARTCLMHVVDRAVLGPPSPAPAVPDWDVPSTVDNYYSQYAYRRTSFATGDRSRWHGHAFALATDWIHPYLSTAEKERIRNAFLLWMDQNLTSTRIGNPIFAAAGNDPDFLDHDNIRYAVNNYQTAKIRQMGLMSLALDAADDDPHDPDLRGMRVRGYLQNTVGLWLYQTDEIMRTLSSGGLPPEGFLYGPPNSGRLGMFLLALHTAGWDDPDLFAPTANQVLFDSSGAYDGFNEALIHSYAPKKLVNPDPAMTWRGALHQPAAYGDVGEYGPVDTTGIHGIMMLHDMMTGNAARFETSRWIMHEMTEGTLPERLVYTEDFTRAILLFMVLDPDAPAPADPRPSMPTTHWSPGLQRLLARTDWSEDASYFTCKFGWNTIDHQFGDAGMFELWRDGEWLTKDWAGYGNDYVLMYSPWHNTLCIENDDPQDPPAHLRSRAWAVGSQLHGDNEGDSAIVARSSMPGREYVTGDMTGMYNYTNPWVATNVSSDVEHASRSLLWIKPDHVVVYDRIETGQSGRYKRFWLNLPAEPAIAGNLATATTLGGQHLHVRTLLPTAASISSTAALPSGAAGDETAQGEWMHARLLVEATGGPESVRFLHLLHGADAGDPADAATLVQSDSGTVFEGVAFGQHAAMFRRDLVGAFAGTHYNAPISAWHHMVTGLSANEGYSVGISDLGNGSARIAISHPGPMVADAGGVLEFSTALPVVTSEFRVE